MHGCIIVTSLVSLVLTESSINIDISISGENGRNTTSTVIKTQDSLATSVDCDNRNVSVGSDLMFVVDNVIGVSGNLSWSADNIVNIDCVTGTNQSEYRIYVILTNQSL